MSAVQVIINEKNGCSCISSTRYDVIIKVTPEFRNEPEELISDEEKAEYISQIIKEEFYKVLTKNNEKISDI